MSLLEAIILGIVEGITEYLPVSSTGHLILASSLMGLTDRVDKESLDAFNIVIQGGAILAVLGLYRERVWAMARGLAGRDPVGLRLLVNVMVAFLPAAAAGALLAGTVRRHLFFPGPVLAALALGGVGMILIGRWQRRHLQEGEAAGGFVDMESLTIRHALTIGVLQCVALWPGTSRSMMSIVGGMLVGMRPRQAAEFSFILGLPTLGAACAYSAMKDFSRGGGNMVDALGVAPMLVGLIVATVSAALAVRWLVSFLTRRGLALFGWYRLGLCLVMAMLIWNGVVTIAPEEAVPATPLVSPERPPLAYLSLPANTARTTPGGSIQRASEHRPDSAQAFERPAETIIASSLLRFSWRSPPSARRSVSVNVARVVAPPLEPSADTGSRGQICSCSPNPSGLDGMPPLSAASFIRSCATARIRASSPSIRCACRTTVARSRWRLGSG